MPNRHMVRLRGYVRRNLGDDLMLFDLISRYPRVDFLMSAPSEYLTPFNVLPNLKLVPRVRYVDGLARRLNLGFVPNSILDRFVSRKCRALIYIGGSIFQEKEGWEQRLGRYRDATIKGRPTFVLGANLGPVRSQAYVEALSEYLGEAAHIGLRDHSSQEMLAGLGNTSVHPDIVLSSKSVQGLSYKAGTIGGLVVSTIDLVDRPELSSYFDSYTSKVAQLVERTILSGTRVTLMGFCSREGDMRGAGAILAKIKDARLRQSVGLYEYRGDIAAALEFLASSAAVIGTRLHSSIIAWRLAKPLLPIAYSDKTVQALRTAGYTGKIWNVDESDAWDIDEMLVALAGDAPQVPEEVKMSAEQHYAPLDEFLALMLESD